MLAFLSYFCRVTRNATSGKIKPRQNPLQELEKLSWAVPSGQVQKLGNVATNHDGIINHRADDNQPPFYRHPPELDEHMGPTNPLLESQN
jgi:hypothetical protein